MAVHTCPRCELRFEHAVELAAHLRDDHDVHVDDPPPTFPGFRDDR